MGGRAGGCCIHDNIHSFYWAGAVMQILLTCSWAGVVSSPLGEDRGRGGCCIHKNISCMWLGRGSNAKTAREGKVLLTDRPSD